MKSIPPPRPPRPPLKEECKKAEWQIESVTIFLLALSVFGLSMFFICAGIIWHDCPKYKMQTQHPSYVYHSSMKVIGYDRYS